MRSILLALLLGCGGTEVTPPDAAPIEIDATAPIEPSCTVTAEAPVPSPAPFGGCLVTVTADVTCSPGVHDRMLIGWARLLDDPRTAGLAEVAYRCGETASARFTVPCDGPTDIGAAMQHPQLGGDLYADAAPRIVCERVP